MSMYRMAGTSDGDLATDDTFAEAVKARFAVDSPPDEPVVDEPGGEDDGSSPLPESSPPEQPGDDGGFVDPEELPSPTEPPVEVPVEVPAEEIPPAPDDFDLNELFARYYGERPTPQQMTALLSFVDSVQRLSPDQQAAVNAIMSGQPAPTAPPTAPTPTPSYSQPTPAPTFDDLTPEARAYLEPLYAQQQDLAARLRAQEESTARANLQAQQNQIVAGIQSASTDFVAEYGANLTPTDFVILETRAQQSGQFPFFMSQHNDDPARAYRALLDTLAYSDPDIRARLVAGTPNPAQDAVDNTRKAKAAAVAAGGQAGRRVSPLDSGPETPPTDPTAARQWAINEISRATGMPRIS